MYVGGTIHPTPLFCYTSLWTRECPLLGLFWFNTSFKFTILSHSLPLVFLGKTGSFPPCPNLALWVSGNHLCADNVLCNNLQCASIHSEFLAKFFPILTTFLLIKAEWIIFLLSTAVSDWKDSSWKWIHPLCYTHFGRTCANPVLDSSNKLSVLTVFLLFASGVEGLLAPSLYSIMPVHRRQPNVSHSQLLRNPH